MTARTLVAVSAGLGTPSASRLLADRLAEATGQALADRGLTVQTQVADLRDHAQDITSALLTGVPTGELPGLIGATVSAAGLIAVTPTFNSSYSGLFKMFFDILEPGSLDGTPVLIGATGNTPRHSLALDYALRPLFGYLRSVVVPTGVYAAGGDWGAGADAAALSGRIARAGDELAALMADRDAPAAADPYAGLVPFEQLLSG